MGFLDRLLGREQREREREGGDDPHKAGHPDDPRGGVQSAEYRTADPRDVVEQGGTMMAGPAGTPQDEGPADDPDAAGLENPEKNE